MGLLGGVVRACEAYDRQVEDEVRLARSDATVGDRYASRWRDLRSRIPTSRTPTGVMLPRLALPDLDEPGAIARYLHGQGLPGEFPFVNAAYREMYLERTETEAPAIGGGTAAGAQEEPTRLFAGLGLAEETNARFRHLLEHQKSVRLSTAFDGPTLYGVGADASGVFGKIGEGGVAIDTVEDMERLYAGFDLTAPSTSVSMTINGPAPILLAMYVAAVKRRFGSDCVPLLRGTVQADVLKEVQAQNEMLFPIDASLRFLGDMVEYCARRMPRWYPISISGYHIAEAGATPIQQAAYTLSNGFAYVEMFAARGLDVNEFGPRLSFFLDCGLDIEYLALARVCRKIWAIGMRDVFHADDRAQRFKLHTQTSGRSLVAQSFKNNLTRTAVELMTAYMNATNSCHSNSADEPFTTPGEEYVTLAANAQSILLEESGLFKHMMNTLGGSPGMLEVQRAVERGVLEEFRTMDELGGVLAAVEHRHQRSQIQMAAHRYERQIGSGERPIVGLNCYRDESGTLPDLEMVRTPRARKAKHLARLRSFQKRNRVAAGRALDQLSRVVEGGGNVFAELIDTVEVCSLGQITRRLHELVGHFRPLV
jgi:methylmalonyl-CoA mutase cobalamin-binding domain/chain